ncbi:hypothetical protein B0T19DRAFT_24561 [Cercophora scortea]|uniref:Uncharacterized protein n=1 Tax=Cercophora scortea TaxID=314031 RepID=A0AAE0J3Q0_9PEZI|nr:hypothetical protein B0T19DRAFT_24561 [Cercophora scortea]
MSAVKNLRAMFEQKQGETSPPDRGRSPGIPSRTPSAADSPRPLSKVRTSFIAIEKDGRIGLQRENSQDSAISATRKLSGETDRSTPPALSERSNIFEDNMSKTSVKTSLKNQPILESPRADSSVQAASLASLSSNYGLSSNAEATTSAERRPKRLGHDGASDNGPISGNGSMSTGEPALTNGERGGKGKDPENVEKAHGKAADKEASKAGINSSAKAASKSSLLMISSSAKTATKSSKSPTAGKTPRSPAEASTPKLSAKTPERKVQQPEKTATPKATAAAPKPVGPSSAKRPPPLQPSPASTGFVKPKPKSPTRPIKLPPSLTTHTTASGSKINAPRQSLSRGSGAIPNLDSVGRSPSRVSASNTAGSGSKPGGTKTLKRQNSTINRPRPSLGPPPKQAARDHPPTRKEREVDEGFLARMMRPTQASSSKAAEKAPISPPRKPTVAHQKEGKPVKKHPKTVKSTVASSQQSHTSNPVATEGEQSARETGEVTPTRGPALPVGQSGTPGEAIEAEEEAHGELAVSEHSPVEGPVEESVNDAAGTQKLESVPTDFDGYPLGSASTSIGDADNTESTSSAQSAAVNGSDGDAEPTTPVENDPVEIAAGGKGIADLETEALDLNGASNGIDSPDTKHKEVVSETAVN